MSEILKSLSPLFTVFLPIIGFIYWHFKSINSFKDEINKLRLELKDLEKKDDLQQQTLDQLKELYPILKLAIDKLKKN